MGDWDLTASEETQMFKAYYRDSLKHAGYRIVKLKHWGTWPHDFNIPDDKVTLWEVTEEL